MKRTIYMYKGFERIWHWLQAALIILLLLTGFEIHGSYELFGYQGAYVVHIQAAWILLGLLVLALFWHVTTGEWRQYKPTLKNLDKMVRCYMVGIFLDEPRPYTKTPETKLNPLQKLSYLGVLLFILPILIISGLGCYFYNDLQAWGLSVGFGPLAILHTIGAFLMLTFLVIHVYMTTTGHSPLSYTIAMITGREEVPEDNRVC